MKKLIFIFAILISLPSFGENIRAIEYNDCHNFVKITSDRKAGAAVYVTVEGITGESEEYLLADSATTSLKVLDAIIHSQDKSAMISVSLDLDKKQLVHAEIPKTQVSEFCGNESIAMLN